MNSVEHVPPLIRREFCNCSLGCAEEKSTKTYAPWLGGMAGQSQRNRLATARIYPVLLRHRRHKGFVNTVTLEEHDIVYFSGVLIGFRIHASRTLRGSFSSSRSIWESKCSKATCEEDGE